MTIKIYTKTKHFKTKQHTYLPKMYGVIEGPIHQMLKSYPNDFCFIRHESKRSLRPSAKNKKERNGNEKGEEEKIKSNK